MLKDIRNTYVFKVTAMKVDFFFINRKTFLERCFDTCRQATTPMCILNNKKKIEIQTKILFLIFISRFRSK